MEWFSVKRFKCLLVQIVWICYKYLELLPVSRSWSPSRHHSLLEYLSFIGHEEVVFLLALIHVLSECFCTTYKTLLPFFCLKFLIRFWEIICNVRCRFETSWMNVRNPLIIRTRQNMNSCNLSVCKSGHIQAINCRFQVVRMIR